MHTMLDNFCWKTFLKRNFCCYLQKLPLVNGNYTRCHWLLVPVGSKFLYTKLHRLSNGIFCWMHSFKKLCWKPWFMWCLLLLYVRIPIQQILHVLLTLDYEFVNYLVNWFLLPWLWHHRMIYVTGRSSQIYQHFHSWVWATLYRETLLLVDLRRTNEFRVVH